MYWCIQECINYIIHIFLLIANFYMINSFFKCFMGKKGFLTPHERQLVDEYSLTVIQIPTSIPIGNAFESSKVENHER